jgi:hypothetical protein
MSRDEAARLAIRFAGVVIGAFAARSVLIFLYFAYCAQFVPKPGESGGLIWRKVSVVDLGLTFVQAVILVALSIYLLRGAGALRRFLCRDS